MKKVLVTGASGAIGVQVIKYLLSEGKYEITALDLRVKKSQKRLRKYRRRINLVYGDMNDAVLMDSLVKGHDYIIHLAGAIPPLADIKRNLGEMVDFNGTKNIINAINIYNPNCFLVYASSTSIYGDVDIANVKTESNLTEIDYYSNTKLKVENLISKNLKNYTIIRVPLLLCNPKSGAFMYHAKRLKMVEAITDYDAGYLFAKAIEEEDKLKKKVWNASGGEEVSDIYANILSKVLEIYGISFRYLNSLLFMDKNFYTCKFKDSDKLENILEFRSDSLSSYYMRLKREVKGRKIQKFLAKPFIYYLKRKTRHV